MILRYWTGRSCRSARVRSMLAALAALTVAGCNHTDPAVTGSIPAAPAAGSVVAQTVAFESVDGPPRPVFDRFVAALSGEAERRALPVVTHTGPSAYRVRVYLATYVEKKKNRATLAWTWDVFDTRDSSGFRLSGEEVLGQPQGDVWAQVGDDVLQRVATRAFAELSARLGSPAPAPASPPASGPAVAFTGAQ